MSAKLGVAVWNKGLKMTPEQRVNMGRPEISAEQRKLNLWGGQIKHKYGVTIDQYNQMFAEQNGCCAICKIHQSDLKKRLDVDHDHVTDKVRGLLCNSCNKALGLLKDSLISLENASIYLKKEG